MPISITRDEVQHLAVGAAQLIEVLPPAEYDWAHLPGSRNIPLSDLTAEATADLDRTRPMIVSCNDFQ